MLTVVAILAQKGGVGKSSLAVSLAVANDLAGGQSALVDLDPQGTASVWGRLRGGDPPEVVSAHPPRLRRVIGEARKAVREFGAEVCPVVIGQRVAHAKAFVRGRSAQEFEPASKAAAEVADLYDWISRRAT